MNTTNILVIGSGFGSYYTHAIAADKRYTLAGIVGKGGHLGLKLAAQMNCPYYNNLAQALQHSQAQAAVVAVKGQIVGGEGDNIARQLLQSHIPVLQELPIHSQDFLQTLRIAKQYSTNFAINPFYDRLGSVIQLRKIITALSTQTQFISIELRTTIQTFLQGQLVLATLLNSSPSQYLGAQKMAGKHKWLISSQWGNIAVDTLLHHRFNPQSPDDGSQPLFGLTLSTNDGELFLPSLWAKPLWERRLQQSQQRQSAQSIDIYPDQTILSHLPFEDISPLQMRTQHIYPAIQAAINALLNPDADYQQQHQRQLAVLRHVECITHDIGAAGNEQWSYPRHLYVFDGI